MLKETNKFKAGYRQRLRRMIVGQFRDADGFHVAKIDQKEIFIFLGHNSKRDFDEALRFYNQTLSDGVIVSDNQGHPTVS